MIISSCGNAWREYILYFLSIHSISFLVVVHFSLYEILRCLVLFYCSRLVKDGFSLTFAKTAFVESGNLKTLDSHEIWSNRSLEKSMAHRRTQPIFDVVPFDHGAKLPPSRAVVYCTTSCQGDAAATCAICVFLSRALLQGSSFASNVSAACIGSS